MRTKEPYSYVVLRYIHDILTGEFVNVGLVMLVPNQPQVLTKVRNTFGRIKKVFPDLDATSYKTAIKAIERGLNEVEGGLQTESRSKGGMTAGDCGRLALPPDDSSLQWSPAGGGLTENPRKTFDQLYHRFVTYYDHSVTHRRSDEDVWQPVKTRLKERNVNIKFRPKTIKGNTDTVKFRRAWKNGRWHAYEPLSFDLSDAEKIKDKARLRLGHLSAVKGGAKEDFQVHFILGRPQNASLMPSYDNAVSILREVPFDNEVYDETQIDDVVQRIIEGTQHHEGGAS